MVIGRGRSALAAAALLLPLWLSACSLLDAIDPTRCAVRDVADLTFTLEDFRLSQTNQLPDNSIPLIVSRGAGLRVNVGASVERATIGDFSLEVRIKRSDGATEPLMARTFDCIRPENIATADLPAGSLQEGDSLELRVLSDTGAELISEVLAPRFIAGEDYRLLFVRLTVNGEAVSVSPEMLAYLVDQAYRLYPARNEVEELPPLDLGRINARGLELAHETLARLRTEVDRWDEDGLLPEHAVVIGLQPRQPNGGWGVGGGRRGVSLVEKEQFVHELGHALGAPHANGCDAPDPLEGSTATVFPLGYDHVSKSWVGGNDILSYCRPQSWIGAPIWARIVEVFKWLRTSSSSFTTTPVIVVQSR